MSFRDYSSYSLIDPVTVHFLVVGGVVYWLIGFPLAFGTGNAFIGWDTWLIHYAEKNDVALCWFDFLHALTAASIAAGAVAGRCHRVGHVAFSVLLTGKYIIVDGSDTEQIIITLNTACPRIIFGDIF